MGRFSNTLSFNSPDCTANPTRLNPTAMSQGLQGEWMFGDMQPVVPGGCQGGDSHSSCALLSA